ncbi:MAG: L-aspartate oxidase [Desulfovibrio sp.]|nr:L-aspartate oxidase [Desulfovibrio sp.]
MQIQHCHVPVLIIGSGLAGCSAALTLADAGHDVLLVSESDHLGGGNSELAQGGIIYKAAEGTAAEEALALERDILVAGHEYNSVKAVKNLCEQGPACVDKVLIERVQVPFDKGADGAWDLTREGGHGRRRILHKADYSGAAIMDGITEKVRSHRKVRILYRHAAVDLLTSHHSLPGSQFRYEVENRCLGAYVLNEANGETLTVIADHTVLATGGVGQIFLHSTNAPSCVGSAISMAARAGVELSNLEFMQFHPTTLFSETSARCPLITEALRGEGGRLVDDKGEPFMHRHDKRGDLAPRDIVSQAMMEEMLATGAPCLYLDATKVEADLPTRFPTVFQECQEIGIDIRREPIPVVPGAHYFCGGILVGVDGRTSMPGLYAIGECACTGLHGANRLASTSLLEALVWGVGCGNAVASSINAGTCAIPAGVSSDVPEWEHEGDDENDDPALVSQDWSNIRSTMWNYVGISRSKMRLRRAFEEMRDLVRHIHDFYKHTPLSRRLLNLFQGVQTAYVITQAAMRNKQSLGCHHRID